MDIFSERIDEWVSKLQKKITQNTTRKTPIIINEIAQEAMRMYDAFIDTYYDTYSPTSYIRHMYRGKGFSMGLYDANNIQATNTGVNISITGEKMMDDYEHDSSDTVLDTVSSGIRGIPKYWSIPWTMSYQGSYYSYSGKNMTEAFNGFVKNAIPKIVKQKIGNILQDILN